MKQLTIILLGLISFAYGQFSPTSAKTKFVNGLSIGSKDSTYFTNAGDTVILYIGRDSAVYTKFKGSHRRLAFDGSLGAYKLISDSLFASGYTRRDRTKQQIDSLGAVKYGGTITTNTIPKATGANTFGNSNITDNGTTVTVSSNARINGLGVNTAPTANSNFRIGGTLTGGVTAGSIINIYAVQSPVTTAGYGYFNQVSTSASSFTLGNLYHYYADQSTFGAGSIVNNQHGFFAEATLTGAAFNYGFRGDIPAGANRWNAFMGGTANNHLNGRTLFGTTVDNGVDRGQFSGSVISTQYKLSALNTAPSSASDTGTLGEIRIDANFIYICTATNTWKRVAIATW